MNIQQQQAALAALPTDQTAIPILQKIAQGQHPMFPPGTEWMGLAKMNEVKRSMEAAQAMQQSAMAAPQGTTTVRDQVQQGVAALAQQQAQQQQMQQAILSGRQAPGVPAMAAGGAVARYAAGDKVEPPEPRNPLAFLNPGDMAGAVKRWVDSGQPLLPYLGISSTRDVTNEERETLRRTDKDTGPAEESWAGGRTLSPETVQRMLKSGTPEEHLIAQLYLKKFPDGAIPQAAPAPAPDNYRSAPAGPSASAPAPVRTAPGGIATLATKAELPTFEPELPEDPVAARKALVAGEPLLQGDQFADRRKYADILAQREQAAAARNAADAPELERAAWTRKLLAAANAAGSQGGLKGIAAALGGFGAQSVKESDANRARREQQITLQQQAEDLRVKYQQETAAAERAVAEGRVAEALKHRENIRAIKEAAKKLRYEALLEVYEKDRDSEEKALDRQNRLDVQGVANEGSVAAVKARGVGGADGLLSAKDLNTVLDDVRSDMKNWRTELEGIRNINNPAAQQAQEALFLRKRLSAIPGMTPQMVEYYVQSRQPDAKPASTGPTGKWGTAEVIPK